MTGRMLRYEIHVGWTNTPMTTAPVVHVGSRALGIVEFWTYDQGDRVDREYQVVGTGQTIPDGWDWRGTTVDGADKALVWHLIERVLS